jgi:anti-sigma regulatory factor (Ser/Thr protein kinase)
VRRARSFPADPQSVPAARHFATAALSDTSVELRQEVELMVSELATNGIQHGRTSFELTIERTVDEIRVQVTDRGGGTPFMRSPTPEEPTGRGLRIVDMLSDSWGIEWETDVEKTVWFTVAVGETEAISKPQRR